jgi:hypothetical protein
MVRWMTRFDTLIGTIRDCSNHCQTFQHQFKAPNTFRIVEVYGLREGEILTHFVKGKLSLTFMETLF